MKHAAIFILSLFYFSACSRAEPNSSVAALEPRNCAYKAVDFLLSERGLKICGTMNFGFAELALDRIEEAGTKIVFLESAGGVSGEAIKFAQALNENEVSLIVEDVCLSACASFLLMLTESVTVSDETLIGFHQTAFAQLNMMAEIQKSISPNSKFGSVRLNRLKTFSFMEVAAYAQKEMDPTALVVPFEMLGIRCLRSFETDRNQEYHSFDASARWWFTVPDKQWVITHRGSDISGWWPSGQADVISTVKAHFDEPDKFIFFRFFSGADYSNDKPREPISVC